MITYYRGELPSEAKLIEPEKTGIWHQLQDQHSARYEPLTMERLDEAIRTSFLRDQSNQQRSIWISHSEYIAQRRFFQELERSWLWGPTENGEIVPRLNTNEL